MLKEMKIILDEFLLRVCVWNNIVGNFKQIESELFFPSNMLCCISF